MIQNKKIYVDGNLVESFTHELSNGEVISFVDKDGNKKKKKVSLLQKPTRIMLLFHKPVGYVVSKLDKHNKTIYDILPRRYHNFYYIGRLDKDSHGLLLMTNDSALVHTYESPSSHIAKHYTVVLDKKIGVQKIQKLLDGFFVDQRGSVVPALDASQYRPVHFLRCKKVTHLDDGRKKIEIILEEGKKRHIRRLCKGLGYQVVDLMRTKVGSYSLGSL